MDRDTSTEASPDVSALDQRSWQNLEKWQLAFGLAIAPVVTIGLGYGLGFIASEPTGIVSMVFGGLPFTRIAVPAVIWSLTFGAFYLATSSRRSGSISRANCFFLGGLSAVLFPPILSALGLAVTAAVAPGAETSVVMQLSHSVWAGLILTPFGVVGGWIFWLIGVRPAAMSARGVEQVFE